MKFRRLNQLRANVFGYFWLPCPICGQMFGGHEASIAAVMVLESMDSNKGRAVCKDCACSLAHIGERLEQGIQVREYDKAVNIICCDGVTRPVQVPTRWQL